LRVKEKGRREVGRREGREERKKDETRRKRTELLAVGSGDGSTVDDSGSLSDVLGDVGGEVSSDLVVDVLSLG